MTDTAAKPARAWTVRTAIKYVLGLQLVLALFLVGGGLMATLPQLTLPSRQPAFDTPVMPGDQTRRYRPGDMPLDPARDGTPARPFTSTGDMPNRLAFELSDGTLSVTGKIADADATRFEEFLEANTQQVTRIRLNSPGGSVRDALSIGREIRDLGMSTIMGAGDICLSACPYILSGGSERVVHRDAQVGVHQHYFGSNTMLPAFLAVEDIQRGQGEVMTFLDQMGIDPLVMRHALVTPPDEIYVLLRDQLLDYRLATELVGAE